MKPWVCFFFFGHNWDKYTGYYEEKVNRSQAKCKRCGIKYENTRSGGRSH